MTHLHRTIIFYLFLLVFLISAPLLILYTSGYRYSFRTGRIARVGALVLKSVPREASIFLNDRKLKEQTPVSLELAEDEYEVEVHKDGFHAWKKLLPVKSQTTTFAEDIVLWKDSDSIKLADTIPLAVSRDAAYSIAYDAVSRLILYNRSADMITPVTDLPVSTNNIRAAFSPNEDLALVTHTDANDRIRFIALRIPDGTLLDTDFISRFAFQELVWGESAGTLYGVSGGRLRAANLLTRRVDSFAQSNAPFRIRGTEVWSILKENRVFLAKSRAGDLHESPEPVVELAAGSYTILPAPDPYLLLHEQTHDQLLLIDLDHPTEIIAELTANHAAWSGEEMLVAWNDFELWIVNAQTGEQELLRRQSEPIQDVTWYPHGNYLAIASGDRMEMFELDSRGIRNTTVLARFPDHRVEDLLINPDGTTIFITVTNGPDAGFYSLELQ